MNQETIYTLVKWFQEVRTPYFFRKDRNPYRVWVSEVVLQQTRIQAALEPLKRFFKCFPDINSLAEATEEKVVFEFRGLGYYSRARNLRKGAIYIKNKCGGVLPQSYEELLKIPSIGPYTAAAVSSICFGKRHPVCDGNVKRVLIRLQKWEMATQDKKTEERCLQLLHKLYCDLQAPAGDANEAIMELGQKICTRSNPLCTECPIAKNCVSFYHGVAANFPLKKEKPQKIDVTWHVFLVHKAGKILLQNWKDFYFLKKQMSFPSILEFNERQITSWRKTENPHMLRGILNKYSCEKISSIKHGITKHRIVIQPYLIFTDKWERNSSVNIYKWVKESEVQKYLVASALTKVWKEIHNENS